MLSLASLHHVVVDANAVVNDAHLKVVVILDRHGDTGGLSMFTPQNGQSQSARPEGSLRCARVHGN